MILHFFEEDPFEAVALHHSFEGCWAKLSSGDFRDEFLD